jgi:hypothetical protein
MVNEHTVGSGRVSVVNVKVSSETSRKIGNSSEIHKKCSTSYKRRTYIARVTIMCPTEEMEKMKP